MINFIYTEATREGAKLWRRRAVINQTIIRENELCETSKEIQGSNIIIII